MTDRNLLKRALNSLIVASDLVEEHCSVSDLEQHQAITKDIITRLEQPARCDDYCSNHGCNNGPNCPARSSAWRKRQISDQGPT
jgi:hypothetical protein